jgi:hypothetical protein
MPRGANYNGNSQRVARQETAKKQGFKTHRSAEFSGWVNVNISETAKAAFQEFEQSVACLDAMDIVCKRNIRISVVQEAGEEGYVASAFYMDESAPSAGLMVSQRSGSAFRAVAKLAYCIVELMPDDWSELLTQGKADW